RSGRGETGFQMAAGHPTRRDRSGTTDGVVSIVVSVVTSARINPAWLAFLGSAALLAFLLALLIWHPGQPSAGKSPLIVYCAAGVKTPVETVAREYEKTDGAPIQLQYGGSQTLLASLEISRRG